MNKEGKKYNKYKKSFKDKEKKSTAEEVYSDMFFDLLYQASQNGISWSNPNVFQKSYGQRSYTTDKEYNGVNAFVLGLASIIKDFNSNYWLTSFQAHQIGEEQGKNVLVKKGEHGFPLVHWHTWEKKDKETGEVILDENGKPKIGCSLSYWTVFNCDQFEWDGIAVKECKVDPIETPDLETMLQADEFLTQSYKGGAPKIRHDRMGKYNCYYPMLDEVAMFPYATFKGVDEYFSTLAHELVHSTGHESRLNRKSSCDMHTQSYANEELVAEVGASMLTGLAGINTTLENSGAYLGSWLSRFKDKKTQLYKAFTTAQKAVNWILGR